MSEQEESMQVQSDPPPAEGSAPDPPRPRFRPYLAVMLLPFLVAILEYGAASLSSSDDNTDTVSYLIARAIGAFLITLLLAWVLGWIGYRIARRSRVVGNLAFCAMSVLCVIAMFVPEVNIARRIEAFRQQSQANDAAMSGLREDMSHVWSDMRDRFDEKGYLGPGDADYDGSVAALKKAKAASSGVAQISADAGIKALEWLKVKSEPYNQAYAAYMESGGYSPGKFTSREMITEELALVERIQAANAEMTEAVRELPSVFRRHLLAGGLDAATANAASIGYRKSAHIALILQIRETDRQLFLAFGTMLKILHDDWGQWEWDPDQEMPLFQSDVALEAFNKAADELNEAAAAETDYQRQLVEAQSSGQS